METSASGGRDEDGRTEPEVCFYHCVYESACTFEHRCPWRFRFPGAGFPETGVTGSSEPPNLGAGN